MADTQPPEAPSILDSLTREELVEAILLREHERDAFHDANTAAVKIAAFNLRGWRTALARAERAEGRAEELFGELEEAKQQREDAETERNCQAATDAATIASASADCRAMAEFLRFRGMSLPLAVQEAVIRWDKVKVSRLADDDNMGLGTAAPQGKPGTPTTNPPAAPDGAPRFKVGDKVVIRRNPGAGVFTVKHNDRPDGCPYELTSLAGNDTAYFWSDSELDPAPKPALRPFDAACAIARKYSGQTKPEPKFKAGQRVRFVSKVASAHDGAVGTIVTVLPDGLFIVRFHNHLLDGCYAEDQLAPEGAQP